MKQFITIIFLLLASTIFAQTLFTKTDTIPIYADSVILSIPEKTRGEIKWQYSKDSETWQYINTSHKDSLLIDNFDSSGFYRAEIIDGTCNPIYSDTTYILRELTSEEELVLLESEPNITFVGSGNGSTFITVIDSTDIYNKIEIHSNQITDSIKPGWILIDTTGTGTGRIILVEDLTILKSSNLNNDLKEKIIKGVEVGLDFMFTDQYFSYSSPANRTKNAWDSPSKLASSSYNDAFKFEIKSQGENFTASIANDKIALSFNKTDLWKVKNGSDQLSITIEKGSIELKPSLDFAATYKPIAIATKLLSIGNPALLLASDYITKGDWEKLKIITYNDLDFNLDFKISVSTKADLSGFIKPVSLGKFTYAVMAGPVVLTIQTELIARLTTAISGEIDISPKMEWNNNVVLGVEANKIADEIDRNFIYNYSSEKSLSTSIDGKIKFKERLEIVPRVEVLAMGLVGLKGEIIPYQEFVINASISDNSPLLYDCSLDVGIDANASFLLSAFHSNKLSADIYSKNFEILAKKNLYKRPSSLSYISGNNQVAGSTQILPEPLKAKVVDSRNSNISSCVVFFDVISGGGKLENPYVVSNSKGIVENQWTIGTEGVQEVRLYLKDANEKIIENSLLTYTATISQSTIPTLSTTAVVNITSTTATVDGTITSDGGSSITARGVCWNTTGTPTITDNKTTDGTGTGNYVGNLTGLSENTTYYVRAYATNSVGTAYGEVVSFTTLQNITLPVVNTTAVGNITSTTATVDGTITSDGGAPITARGACWNTNGTPTISDNKTSNGTGTGNYAANLTGLSANTTYYVRAYATNNAGIAYGEVVSFTTLQNITLPVVNTTAISEINETSAISGGNVTSDGGSSITARGICWNTSGNPTISDYKTTDGASTGIYTSSITELTANTNYYVRAYATNIAGIAYGEEISFTTETASNINYGSFTDPRDGHTYKTVVIGEQTWMAENLAYLPSVSPKEEKYGNYYVYDYYGTSVSEAKTTNNYKTYGVLYSIGGALSACPSGWSLPSHDDFNRLKNFLIVNRYNYDGTTADNKIAKSMAAKTNWKSSANYGAIGNNLSLNNASGFSALPGGYRIYWKEFWNKGINGRWWTSTISYYDFFTSYWWMDYDSGILESGTTNAANCYSVRCIKD